MFTVHIHVLWRYQYRNVIKTLTVLMEYFHRASRCWLLNRKHRFKQIWINSRRLTRGYINLPQKQVYLVYGQTRLYRKVSNTHSSSKHESWFMKDLPFLNFQVSFLNEDRTSPKIFRKPIDNRIILSQILTQQGKKFQRITQTDRTLSYNKDAFILFW